MAQWSEAKVSNRPRGIQFDLKTTISSDAVGRMTSGVLPIERMPGITEEARQQLQFLDRLTKDNVFPSKFGAIG